MKIKKILLAFSAALLLLTGCGENTLKREDFNIDPASPTLKEDTKALYDKLSNQCKEETKVWYTAHQNLFEGKHDLEKNVQEYQHYTNLFDEYVEIMPLKTQELITNYKNEVDIDAITMYGYMSRLTDLFIHVKENYPAHTEQTNNIENGLMDFLNASTQEDKVGFNLFASAVDSGCYYIRQVFEPRSITTKEFINTCVEYYYVEILMTISAISYRAEYQSFMNKYNETVAKPVTRYIASYPYWYFGFEVPELPQI